MILVGLFLLPFLATAAEPAPAEMVANMAALAARIKTFQATVVQEQTVNEKPVKREAKFWRAGKDRFRMDMGDVWVIRNGDTLWMKIGKNVTKRTAKEDEGNPMAVKSLFYQFIGGKIEPAQFKSFTLVGNDTLDGEKAYILKAVPKPPGLSEQVWLRAKDWLPVRAIVKSGTESMSDTTITFKNVKIDEPIDESFFTYQGPVSK